MRIVDNTVPEFILLYYKRRPIRRIVYSGIETVYTDGSMVMSKDYIVQRGDNLTDIAHYKGTSVAMLMAQNPQIKNPHLIYPGDVIHFSYTLTWG